MAMAQRKTTASKAPVTARPTRPTREQEAEEPSQAAAYGKWLLRGLVVGALIVAALKIIPPYLQSMAAKPKWDAAVAAFEAGKPQEALRLYKEAKGIAPDWPEISKMYPEEATKCYKAIGLQAEEAGNWVEAATAWKQMIDDLPDQALAEDAWYKAAQSLDRAGATAEAGKFARDAIAKAGGKHELAQKLVEKLGKKK